MFCAPFLDGFFHAVAGDPRRLVGVDHQLDVVVSVEGVPPAVEEHVPALAAFELEDGQDAERRARPEARGHGRGRGGVGARRVGRHGVRIDGLGHDGDVRDARGAELLGGPIRRRPDRGRAARAGVDLVVAARRVGALDHEPRDGRRRVAGLAEAVDDARGARRGRAGRRRRERRRLPRQELCRGGALAAHARDGEPVAEELVQRRGDAEELDEEAAEVAAHAQRPRERGRGRGVARLRRASHTDRNGTVGRRPGVAHGAGRRQRRAGRRGASEAPHRAARPAAADGAVAAREAVGALEHVFNVARELLRRQRDGARRVDREVRASARHRRRAHEVDAFGQRRAAVLVAHEVARHGRRDR